MRCPIHNKEGCDCHQSRIADIRCKEVINVCDGCRLGFPCDVLLDLQCARLLAIVVPGPSSFFGLFGRKEDFVIPWECIRTIGRDAILVEFDEHKHRHRRHRRKFFDM
ncbi:MAG: YlmC/YmxH family sporulation protein [Oscillospiraceae bacterium]|nr:YlmC/YmxH family sporulation protein [Oscillospiraceae bacterium]